MAEETTVVEQPKAVPTTSAPLSFVREGQKVHESKLNIVLAEDFAWTDKDGVRHEDNDSLRLTTDQNATFIARKNVIHNMPTAFGKGISCVVKYVENEWNGEVRQFIRAVEFPAPKVLAPFAGSAAEYRLAMGL